MSATKKDLSELKHVLVPSNLHLYYEKAEDGTNILRHIRVNKHIFQVPADGVTIDVVPPNSVGTDEIRDSGVELRDIAGEAFATDDNIEAIFDKS